MTAPVCHSFSTHIWAAERSCCVQPDAVTWSEPGGARGRIEFSQLRRVQLRNPPGMGVASIGLLDLYPAHGPRLRVSSVHFRGFGQLEDRAASYRDFALALHAALVPHAASIRFRAGSTLTGQVALVFVMAVWTLLMLFGIAVLFSGTLEGWLALTLLPLVPPGLLIWRHMRRHWPRRYLPAVVPLDLLPG
ncbi:MAG: hypothetical protein HZC37_21140 [Burkholderiales bacterium]|nr:hypothetical protein [Burkholderiales bacterium]